MLYNHWERSNVSLLLIGEWGDWTLRVDLVYIHLTQSNKYQWGWIACWSAVTRLEICVTINRCHKPAEGWCPWATHVLSQSQCPICQAIKADGEQDIVSELLENIPLRVQLGKCLKLEKNNVIEYLICHQRPELGRLPPWMRGQLLADFSLSALLRYCILVGCGLNSQWGPKVPLLPLSPKQHTCTAHSRWDLEQHSQTSSTNLRTKVKAVGPGWFCKGPVGGRPEWMTW